MNPNDTLSTTLKFGEVIDVGGVRYVAGRFSGGKLELVREAFPDGRALLP